MLRKVLFKDRLVSLRKEKKLTQYELADKLGFSRGQISNYEQGSREPDQETLIKIVSFFDVSVDFMLGLTDIRKYDTISRYDNNIANCDKLPKEAIDEINNFILYIKQKYKK